MISLPRERALWLVPPLAVCLFWLPLPFASVTRFWAMVAQLLVWMCLGVAVTSMGQRDIRLAKGSAAVLAIAFFALIQSLAWPAGLASFVSPAHAVLQQQAAGLIGIDPSGSGIPLSLAPSVSRSTALAWIGAAAFLLAVVVAANRKESRRWIGATIIVAALFQILYGTRNWFSGSTAIWGVEVPGDPSRLRGTFVNPDHLAIYLELALAISFALGWWAIRRALREETLERRVMLVGLPVLLWIVLFTGLAFTGSRAGLVAAAAGAIAQGILLAARRRRWRVAPVGLLTVLVGLAVVAYIGFQEGFGRLLGTSAYEVSWNARLSVWERSLSLWRQFPATGTGLGTFEHAFPLVQPPELTGLTWTHAHNDYLELLVTGGLVAIVLLMVGVFLVLHRLWKVFFESIRSETRAAALAALGALISVGLHEIFDFGLVMPANALTLTAVVGAALGAHTGGRLKRQEEAGPRRD
jgi:O-antigen ligase